MGEDKCGEITFMRQMTTGIWTILLCLLCLCAPADAQNPRVLAEWPLTDLDEEQLGESYEFHQMAVTALSYREMSLRVKGADPHVVGPELSFDAYEGRRIVINITVQEAGSAAVFFTTEW